MDVKLESLSLPPKSRWEAVLTVTPVILTVLGTLLAGLSSSEMTLAQYYRTLAAQSQAKASDQWAFFQAKRIRGTSLELFVKQLPLTARPSRSSDISGAAIQVAQRLRQAEAAAQQLREPVQRAQDDLVEKFGVEPASTGTALIERSGALAISGRDLAPQISKATGERWFNEMVQAIDLDKPLLAQLGLPERRQPNPAVRQAMADLAAGMLTDQLEAKLLATPPQQLADDLIDAEGAVRDLVRSLDERQNVLAELGKLVETQIRVAVEFHRTVQNFEAVVEHVNTKDAAISAALRQSLAGLSRRSAEVLSAAEQLRSMLQFLEQSYLARSYRLEADRNQQLAQLYELQVRQNGGLAERHRNRSRSFFYGMLCAQAGVTISSLALAARQKNLLWALAGAAGLAALVFSLYVYLFV